MFLVLVMLLSRFDSWTVVMFDASEGVVEDELELEPRVDPSKLDAGV